MKYTSHIIPALIIGSAFAGLSVYSYAQTPPTQRILTIPGQLITNGVTWATGTTSGSIQTIYSGQGAGPPAVVVQLDQGSGIVAGAITFQSTSDGQNWSALSPPQVLNPASLAEIGIPYTLTASTNQSFYILTRGAQGLRIAVSTATSGGSVTPYWTILPQTGIQELNPAGISVAQGASAAGVSGSLIMGVETTSPPAGASGQMYPINQDLNQGLRLGNVCTGVINIAQATSTDVHTFTGYGYLCALFLSSSISGNAIGLMEGTGSVCATSGTNLIGVSGSTAVTPVAPSGGFILGNGVPFMKLQKSGDHLCIIQGGSGVVAGFISYADLTN